jgi:hypothetical protein
MLQRALATIRCQPAPTPCPPSIWAFRPSSRLETYIDSYTGFAVMAMYFLCVLQGLEPEQTLPIADQLALEVCLSWCLNLNLQ